MKKISRLQKILINWLTTDIGSKKTKRDVRTRIRTALTEGREIDSHQTAQNEGTNTSEKGKTEWKPVPDYPSVKGKYYHMKPDTDPDKPLVFTSCTNNYIPKARILASSLKKNNPDWEFCLLLGEAPPEGFNLDDEPFDDLVLFEDLDIPDYWSWLFKHRVVEICTAAKGPALHYFAVKQNRKKVIYLDPDIMVFNSLEPLSELLDKHDVLLTPHQLAPQENYQEIIDNEICSLKHGIYNLGFVAVNNRPQGQAFATWWKDRLHEFCYDDIPNGLFTDQRWCDLAPAFFSNLHIIRDPGYNAASWNLTDRTLTKNEEGVFMANEVPLRFYHFTGYDSGAGATMSNRYGGHMPAVKELWENYGTLLESLGHSTLKKCPWQYLNFPDGTSIPDSYRMVIRTDRGVAATYPNPFSLSTPDNFRHWCYENCH